MIVLMFKPNQNVDRKQFRNEIDLDNRSKQQNVGTASITNVNF
jgi:hypothetical protein